MRFLVDGEWASLIMDTLEEAVEAARYAPWANGEIYATYAQDVYEPRLSGEEPIYIVTRNLEED